VARHLAARRYAVYDDIGRLGHCSPARIHGLVDALRSRGAQHAHVALMSEQFGDDGAKRLVVTGHMYHDHDNSLSTATEN
jgi:hypothetical protein